MKELSFDDTNLFTIGGTKVENANLKVPNNRIQCRQHIVSLDKVWPNFLTNGDQMPKGVVLLYSSDGIPNLSLNTIMPCIEINDYWIKRLQKTIIDIVVYARNTPADKCDIFTVLTQAMGEEEKNYLLRDYDEIWKKDLSLSRCTLKTNSYLPEYFQVTKPTPGAENICDGLHFTFVS